MSRDYRSSRDGDSEAFGDDAGELAPGRRTLTSRLVAQRTPEPDVARPAPSGEARLAEDSDHWKSKFGVDGFGGPPSAGAQGFTLGSPQFGAASARMWADLGAEPPVDASAAATLAVERKGGGRSVDATLAGSVSAQTGVDVSHARVHDDPLSQASTHAMGARAFAHGGDVFLGPGEAASDRSLMAHELTHVAQQRGASAGVQRKVDVGAANDPAEHHADDVAHRVTSGAAPIVLLVDAGPVADGQMLKTDFLTKLKLLVTQVADQELGELRTAIGCPYIEQYFARYGALPASSTEALLKRWIPALAGARAVADMVPAILVRVRQGVRTWKETGQVPPDLAAADPTLAQQAQAQHPSGDGKAQKMSLDSLEAELGPGQPVDSRLARPLGAEGARIHRGAAAQAKAAEHGALAFAAGDNIVMGANAPEPGTPYGDALLAHELAHTAQQHDAAKDPVARKKPIGDESPAAERDADRAAGEAMQQDKLAPLSNFASRIGEVMKTDVQLQRCASPAPAPANDPKVQTAAKMPPPLNVTFGDDLFQVSFAQMGDDAKPSLALTVKYTGPFPVESTAGPGAPSLTINQPLVQPGPLDAAVAHIEPHGISVDTLRNDFDVVKLVDKSSFSTDKKARQHDLSTMLFGKVGATATFWVRDPKAKPDTEKALAQQGDVPGEVVQPIGDATHTQLRLDLDGDKHKESLLEVTVVESYPSGAAKTVGFAVTQIETKTRQVAPNMTLPDDGKPFGYPFQNGYGSDGVGSTYIQHKSPGGGGSYSTAKLLTIDPSTNDTQHTTITLTGDGYSAPLVFPKLLPVKDDSASTPKQIAGFWATDVTLGPYHDKFRLTLEPSADQKSALLVVAPIARGQPAALALSVPAKLPPTGVSQMTVLANEGTGVKFDLNGDGKPELELYLAIAQQYDFFQKIDGTPESNRDLNIRLRGSVLDKESLLQFGFNKGEYRSDVYLGNNAAYAKNHENNPVLATSTLASEDKYDKFEKLIDSYEVMMGVERKNAAAKKLITPELYDVWKALSATVMLLRPQVSTFKKHPDTPVDSQLQSLSVTQALALYSRLALDTKDAPRDHHTEMYWGSYDKNKYTGETFDSHNVANPDGGGAAKALSNTFASAKDGTSWDAAMSGYHEVVLGLDRWIVDQTKKAQGENSPQAQKLEYMAAMQKELADIEQFKPTPLHAVFYPDPKYKDQVEKAPTEVPLSLYYWSTGSGDNQTWHLKDLTNPKKTFEDTGAKGKDEKFPSQSFLEDKLDVKIHFPKGLIYYQYPGGPGGKVETHENKKWYDYVAEIAMIAAIVGLGLVTAGGAVAVAGGWILAASGLAGAVAAGGDMYDHYKHGALDSETFLIDALQIVTGVVSFGAFGAGRVIMREAAATADAATAGGAAAKVTPPPAWLLNMSKKAFLPMRVGSAAGAGLQMLVMTDVAVNQFKELDKLAARGGDAEDIARAKRQIIANIAIQGGFTILAVKGELPTLKQGMDLFISMKGETPVASVGGDLDPLSLKFSQENIAPKTSGGIPLDDLKSSMKNEGWKGDPVQVVQLENGDLVSLDNRRLWAARMAVAEGGLKGPDGNPVKTIPTEIHAWSEPIPQDWAAEGFVAKKNVYRLADGTLTTEQTAGAEVVIRKGDVAKTYGEAVTIRTSKEGTIKEGPNAGKKFPIGGSDDMPRIRKGSGGGGGGGGAGGGAGPGPGGGGGGGGDAAGGNDVELKPPLQVDPNNDAARIQTKSIDAAIQQGETKLDWGKKNKSGTTTLGQEYKKWIESPDPVDFSGKEPKANYKGDPEFAGDIDAIVKKGNITLNLRAQANADAAAKLDLKSLDPASPTYAADRAKLVEKFGADAIARYEQATLGDASDPARKQIFAQVDKIVGPQAIADLRNAFPNCEIYITGSASQPTKGSPGDLAKITDLDVMLVVPDGTDGPGRAAFEARAKTLSVPTTPEFAQATGRSSLPVDATARTKSQALGLMTTPTPTDSATGKPRTPLEYARVDANLPDNVVEARANAEAAQAHDAHAAKPGAPKLTQAEAARRDVMAKYENLTAKDFSGPDDPRLQEISDTARDENREVADRLRAALEKAGVTDFEIQNRAKSVKSILGKLQETPGMRVKDIKDLSGVRVNITKVNEANFTQYDKIKATIQQEFGIPDGSVKDYNKKPNPKGYTGRIHLFEIGGAEIYSEIQVGSTDISGFIEKKFTMANGNSIELHDLTGFKGQLYGKSVPADLEADYWRLVGKITEVNKSGRMLADAPDVKAEVDAYFTRVQNFLNQP